jgi:hypothetical protein
MIQNLRKAQALTEMAIFGTLILLCLHYLLVYVQRMDRQQYTQQEAFRSALEKASDDEENEEDQSKDEKVASVSYNIFSNRRQVSINSPLVGERSQISGLAQVYWGAEEYELKGGYDESQEYQGYGVESTGKLKSEQWYKFNQDEEEWSDKFKGSVTTEELAELVDDPGGLFSDLLNRGYIDAEGNFQDKFTDLEDYSELELDNDYSLLRQSSGRGGREGDRERGERGESGGEDEERETRYGRRRPYVTSVVYDQSQETKADIYYFLQEELNDSGIEITINSSSDQDREKAITYNSNSITSVSSAEEKDKITYTLEDIRGHSETITQAVGEDGEYSRAAYNAGRKVYNIGEGGKKRVWTVSK